MIKVSLGQVCMSFYHSQLSMQKISVKCFFYFFYVEALLTNIYKGGQA